MAVSVVSFSFSMAAQPEHWSSLCWVLAFLTTPRLTPLQLYCLPSFSPLCLLFNSSALYYLQTPTRWYGHASTPPQLLPISSDRDVSLPLPLEWPVWSSSSGNNCHAVQRSLSSGASVYESILGFFFFTSSHFIRQFPPITAIRMCHFLPVHHLGMAFLAGSTGQIITFKVSCYAFSNAPNHSQALMWILFLISRFSNNTFIFYKVLQVSSKPTCNNADLDI